MQVHEPPPRHTSDKLFESVCKWKRAGTTVAKEKISRETGISGESILWKLFHLYDFDHSNDLVFDLMHIAGLNLFKHYTSKLLTKWLLSKKICCWMKSERFVRKSTKAVHTN